MHAQSYFPFSIFHFPFVICHLGGGNEGDKVCLSMTNDKWKMKNGK
jgi:hypothetical protein